MDLCFESSNWSQFYSINSFSLVVYFLVLTTSKGVPFFVVGNLGVFTWWYTVSQLHRVLSRCGSKILVLYELKVIVLKGQNYRYIHSKWNLHKYKFWETYFLVKFNLIFSLLPSEYCSWWPVTIMWAKSWFSHHRTHFWLWEVYYYLLYITICQIQFFSWEEVLKRPE